MWCQLNRVIKKNGAIVLFGSEPFSSALRMSNIKNYKYDWVWQKDKSTNHLNANKMPLRRNELISVFYKSQCLYKPQLHMKKKKDIRPLVNKRTQIENYGKMTNKSIRKISLNMSYPTETLKFAAQFSVKEMSFHPTQKPVKLMEYLIRTYTNKQELILDFTIGSGTTAVAAIQTHRNFIGIEKEQKYVDIARQRISQAEPELF